MPKVSTKKRDITVHLDCKRFTVSIDERGPYVINERRVHKGLTKEVLCNKQIWHLTHGMPKRPYGKIYRILKHARVI